MKLLFGKIAKPIAIVIFFMALYFNIKINLEGSTLKLME